MRCTVYGSVSKVYRAPIAALQWGKTPQKSVLYMTLNNLMVEAPV